MSTGFSSYSSIATIYTYYKLLYIHLIQLIYYGTGWVAEWSDRWPRSREGGGGTGVLRPFSTI